MNIGFQTGIKGKARALALAMVVTVAGTQTGFAQDVTIVVFGGRLGETLKANVILPFEEESKLDVAIDDRDWGIGVIKTRVDAGSNTWDVVSVEAIEVLQGCQEGIFQEIDRSKLPNLADFVVGAEGPACGVPMVLYNDAIAYRKDVADEAPQDWADFWDVEKWPGKRSMRKDPRDALEIALMADGVAREDVYETLSTPEGVDRAFAKLDELKPNLVWWSNAGQARQMLAAGETTMSATYDSGIHYMNRNENTNLGIVLKDAITHIDYWAIVNGSPNEENAYKFLDYASRPEPQAQVSNVMGLSVPNGEALALISADMQPLLSANPENIKQSLAADTQFWLDNYDVLRRRFESWAAQ